MENILRPRYVILKDDRVVQLTFIPKEYVVISRRYESLSVFIDQDGKQWDGINDIEYHLLRNYVKDTSIAIWLDSFSILKNDADIQWHFTRMYDIYQHSKMVLVTLPKHQCICGRIWNGQHFWNEEMISNWANIPEMVGNFVMKYLDCTKRLLRESDWFNRCWTLQEGVARPDSTKVLTQHGLIDMRIIDFLVNMMLALSWYSLALPNGFSCQWENWMLGKSRLSRIRVGFSKLGPSCVFEAMNYRESTVKADRVYSLCSLLEFTEEDRVSQPEDRFDSEKALRWFIDRVGTKTDRLSQEILCTLLTFNGVGSSFPHMRWLPNLFERGYHFWPERRIIIPTLLTTDSGKLQLYAQRMQSFKETNLWIAKGVKYLCNVSVALLRSSMLQLTGIHGRSTFVISNTIVAVCSRFDERAVAILLGYLMVVQTSESELIYTCSTKGIQLGVWSIALPHSEGLLRIGWGLGGEVSLDESPFPADTAFTQFLFD